ncbi:MAG TPA: sulfite exporter TauE/SafE family protein [Vicinamibacterales bacterium]|nr:sulfite exporter TauE/SafE family protein [Vicinamibacterales bacterium]
MNPIALLLSALGALTVVFVAGWTQLVRRIRRDPGGATLPAGALAQPGAVHTGIGFITNFFDTLGIGSFATTTAMWRARGLVPDELIPGTLNVGHTLPTVVQAFSYIGFIEVDVLTLVTMIGAAVAGAWLGAGVVARWPRRKIQIGMGCALLVAATLMLMSQLQLFPVGGEAIGVRGARLVIAVAGNFMLGALMTLGIGLYAPCMILVSLLGMNPRSAFPIMMGSCAFLMPVGSLRFIRERKYHLRAALGLALGGIPGVLIAAFIVKELPLGAIRWLVIVVVVYTALMMLRSAYTERAAAARADAVPSPLP